MNMAFARLITEHRGGDLELAASEKLRLIIAALREYGGKGELTVKLKLSLTPHGMIEIEPTITAKAPEPDLKPSVFYLTENGELSRRDPGQMDIEDVLGVKRIRPAE